MFKRKPRHDNRPRQPIADIGRPQVYSYQANRAPSPIANNNSQPAKRNSSPKSNKYIVFVVGAIVLLIMFYSLWLSGSPTLILDKQPGTITQPPAKYQTALNELWQESLLNRNKITVKSAQMTQDIYDQFPEITKVQINLSLIGQGVSIRLTAAKPVMQLISPNGSFYLDEDGKALAQTNNVIGHNLPTMPVVQDYSGLSASVGKTLLPRSEVDFIRQLNAELLVAKLPIASVNLSANEADEVDVKLTGQGYYLKFSVISDARQSVGAYLAVKAKLDATHQTPAEYVDIRIPEKVFYK